MTSALPLQGIYSREIKLMFTQMLVVNVHKRLIPNSQTGNNPNFYQLVKTGKQMWVHIKNGVLLTHSSSFSLLGQNTWSSLWKENVAGLQFQRDISSQWKLTVVHHITGAGRTRKKEWDLWQGGCPQRHSSSRKAPSHRLQLRTESKT